MGYLLLQELLLLHYLAMKQELLQSIKKEWSRTKTSGFFLVEVLLATSLLVILLTAFASVFYYGIESSNITGNRDRANFLAEEGQEAVRSIKNRSFASLVDGTYGLRYASGTWVLASSSDSDALYTRKVTISTVDFYKKWYNHTL